MNVKGTLQAKSEQFLETDAMAAQELFTVSLEPDPLEWWADESTASTLRALAVQLHSTGISLLETAAVLEQFGMNRSHHAVWQWVHRIAETAPDPPTVRVVSVTFAHSFSNWSRRAVTSVANGAVANVQRSCRPLSPEAIYMHGW